MQLPTKWMILFLPENEAWLCARIRWNQPKPSLCIDVSYIDVYASRWIQERLFHGASEISIHPSLGRLKNCNTLVGAFFRWPAGLLTLTSPLLWPMFWRWHRLFLQMDFQIACFGQIVQMNVGWCISHSGSSTFCLHDKQHMQSPLCYPDSWLMKTFVGRNRWDMLPLRSNEFVLSDFRFWLVKVQRHQSIF